ncbi:ribose 5-phosphate isomerase B [Natranaerobius thermophilus]|uniref:Ribose-5-phosphate isomerase n=1 Tax=Natranaerobius thermophilus (strain ATCC BAA-1301 / DSM 18059 / JW/NM-WN-LF) TaxID=457570 RepID=B2A3H7_NATTJ|nr:ribose 5-phosphate isomerase B [Natranaerobius thermophilus]ACB86406.1 ribose-5-phosphate isomerase [Natranaerobius thermophilus JW/NM-WN-LF]
MTYLTPKKVLTETGQILGIASDHGGLELKQEIINHLQDSGIKIEDLGCYQDESVDYPDYAEKLTQKLVNNEISYGILVCGTGIGISISANKVPGIRAALCHDCFSARMAREHNDANIIALGERIIGKGLALEVVDTFLNSPFGGGRHERRVNKITKLEQKYS